MFTSLKVNLKTWDKMGSFLRKYSLPVLTSEESWVVVLSCVRLCDLMDCQAPLSMGFSRQEYWRGLPFPSSGGVSPTQGSNLCLLHFLHRWAGYLLLRHPGSPLKS